MSGISQLGHCHFDFMAYPEFKSWLKENKVKEMYVVSKVNPTDVDHSGFTCHASHFSKDGSILREREFSFEVQGELLLRDIVSYNDFLLLLNNMNLDKSADSLRRIKKSSFEYKTSEYDLCYEFTSNGELMYLFSSRSGEWWLNDIVYSLNKDVTYDYDANIKRTCIYGHQGYGIEFFPYSDTTEIRESKLLNEQSADGVLTNFEYRWINDYEAFRPRNMEYMFRSSLEQTTYNYTEFQFFRSKIDPMAYFKEVRDLYDFYSRLLIEQLNYIDSCVSENNWEPDSVVVTKQVRSDRSKDQFVEEIWLSFHFSSDNYDSTLFLGSSTSMKTISRQYNVEKTKILMKEYVLFYNPSMFDLRLQNAYGYNDQMQLTFHETFNQIGVDEYRINFNYENGIYSGDEYLTRCIPSETFSDDEKWMKKNYCPPRKKTEMEQKYSRIEKQLAELRNNNAEIILTCYE